MKTLKAVLFSVYALLIVLLLLNFSKNKTVPSLESADNPVEESVDTVDVVRKAEKVGKIGAL